MVGQCKMFLHVVQLLLFEIDKRVFLAIDVSTLDRIVEVIEIDGRIIADGNCGPITEKLSKIHDDTLHGRINSSKKYLTYISK